MRIDAVAPLARWYRPMRARDPEQPHRASTNLELLFDLCFVVAVAVAAGQVHPVQRLASPPAAVLILASAFTPWPLPLIALLMAARVVVEIVAPQGAEQGAEASHGAALAAQTDAGGGGVIDERR